MKDQIEVRGTHTWVSKFITPYNWLHLECHGRNTWFVFSLVKRFALHTSLDPILTSYCWWINQPRRSWIKWPRMIPIAEISPCDYLLCSLVPGPLSVMVQDLHKISNCQQRTQEPAMNGAVFWFCDSTHTKTVKLPVEKKMKMILKLCKQVP